MSSSSATWSQEFNATIHKERINYDVDCPTIERLNIHPNFKVPAVLDNTLYQLETCNGRFCLYLENEDYYRDKIKGHNDSIFIASGKRYLGLDSLAAMVTYCVHDHWRKAASLCVV